MHNLLAAIKKTKKYAANYGQKLSAKQLYLRLISPKIFDYKEVEKYGIRTNKNREWIKITSRIEYESRYPYLPDRIIDNLLNESARISVANWERIFNKPSILSFLINETFIFEKGSRRRQFRRNCKPFRCEIQS